MVDLNGRNVWPMWMPDGRSLYFMSDRGGAQNIWSLALGAKPRQVTKFTDGRVLWPSIGYDGKAIVFERDFKIWQLDTRNGEAYAVPITLVGSAAGPAITHQTLTQFTDLDLSPDARKIALVAHGEVFAASARDGGDAIRVTHTPGPESQVTWAPDSSRIAYLSQRDAVTHLFLYDFTKHAETQLTRDPAPDQGPRFSPDGKSIAFVRNRKELRVIDLDSKQERVLASGFIGGGGREAPAALRGRPTASGSPTPRPEIARCATCTWWRRAAAQAGRSASWPTPTPAPSSGARTASSCCTRPASAPRLRRWRASTWCRRSPNTARTASTTCSSPKRRGRRRGGAEAKPPVKPVEIEFEGIRERISMLPIGLTVSNPQISPDGRWLLVSATVGGQANLYLYPLEEPADGAGARRRARRPRRRRRARSRGS